MQFTKAEEYGIFGVMYLAEKKVSTVTPLSEISRAQNVPEKFLAKIFQSLARSGIIQSHRGIKGGYTLAKPAGEITVRDVVESIQGPYQLMKDAPSERQDCPAFQALREVLSIAEHQLVSVFDRFSLDDLARWEERQKAGHPV